MILTKKENRIALLVALQLAEELAYKDDPDGFICKDLTKARKFMELKNQDLE